MTCLSDFQDQSILLRALITLAMLPDLLSIDNFVDIDPSCRVICQSECFRNQPEKSRADSKTFLFYDKNHMRPNGCSRIVLLCLIAGLTSSNLESRIFCAKNLNKLIDLNLQEIDGGLLANLTHPRGQFLSSIMMPNPHEIVMHILHEIISASRYRQ